MKVQDAAMCGGSCEELVSRHLDIAFYHNDGNPVEAEVSDGQDGALAFSPPDSASVASDEQFTFSIKAKSQSAETQSFINSLIINRYDEVNFLADGATKKVS